MSAILADTHAIIWLLFARQTLSKPAFAALNGAIQSGAPIYVASISVIEVIYLVEKGKFPTTTLNRLITELYHPHSGFEVIPLDLAIATTAQQIPRIIVPDMPDRIIAATALQRGLPLVTKDLRIRAANLTTIW